MIATILAFVGTPLGRMAAGGAALLLFVSAFALDQRQRGAEKVVAKIERKDNAAADHIRKADALSRAAQPGRVRGLVRDPNTVSE